MALYDSATTYDSVAVYDGIPATTRPTLRVRLATDFSGTTSVDITANVQRVRITRGRGPLAFDRYDPGRCTIELVDSNSSFYPPNTAGYKPTVNTPVAVDMVWGSEVTNLFYGFCDEIQTVWVKGTQTSFVALTFTDGMKLLAKANTTVNGTTGDRPATRLAAYLGDISLGISPSGTVAYESALTYDSSTVYGGEYTLSIDTLTDVTLQADPTARRSALSAMQRVEQAEAGALFFDGSGKLCFRGRGLAWPTGPTVVAFSDPANPTGAHVATYTDVKSIRDEQLLFNRVTVTRDGTGQATAPVEQLAEDTASQDQFFTRDLNQVGVLVASDAQASTLATFLLSKRNQPLDRFEQIGMAAYASEMNLYAALNLDLLDVVSLTRSEASASASSVALVVAGVQHDITPADWRVVYTTQARV